jgi:hypothetical protein
MEEGAIEEGGFFVFCFLFAPRSLVHYLRTRKTRGRNLQRPLEATVALHPTARLKRIQ